MWGRFIFGQIMHLAQKKPSVYHPWDIQGVAEKLTCSLLRPPSSWTHSDGTASGFKVRRTLPLASKGLGVKFSKQSSAKWLQQTLKSLQDDSLNCCSFAVAKNWTQSSLLSGSLGNLNRCARLVHPATEHISRRTAELCHFDLLLTQSYAYSEWQAGLSLCVHRKCSS